MPSSALRAAARARFFIFSDCSTIPIAAGSRSDRTSFRICLTMRFPRSETNFRLHFSIPFSDGGFTAQENVMIPMRRLARLSEEQMRERAAELLDAVGLANKPHGRAVIFPAANNSGSRSPARWPTIPGSSWPMSRPAISTPRIRERHLNCCRTSLSARARKRFSSSPTIPRSPRPAIGFTRCRMAESVSTHPRGRVAIVS